MANSTVNTILMVFAAILCAIATGIGLGTYQEPKWRTLTDFGDMKYMIVANTKMVAIRDLVAALAIPSVVLAFLAPVVLVKKQWSKIVIAIKMVSAILAIIAILQIPPTEIPRDKCLKVSSDPSVTLCPSTNLTDPYCPMSPKQNHFVLSGTDKTSINAFLFTTNNLDSNSIGNAVYTKNSYSGYENCTRVIFYRRNGIPRAGFSVNIKLSCCGPEDTYVDGGMRRDTYGPIFDRTDDFVTLLGGMIAATIVSAISAIVTMMLVCSSDETTNSNQERKTQHLRNLVTQPNEVLIELDDDGSVASTSSNISHSDVMESKEKPKQESVPQLAPLVLNEEYEMDIRKSMRRLKVNHGAFIKELNCMFVVGGENAEGVATDDIVSFSLDDRNVSHVTLLSSNSFNRIFASCIAVGNQIVVFGGNLPDDVGEDEDEEANNVLVLQIEQEGSEYRATETEIHVVGTPPSNRSKSSMVSLGDDRIIVFGGIETGRKTSSRIFDVLKDTFLLIKAEETGWMWQQLDTIGSEEMEPRCHHAAVVWNNKMIVFGGKDEDDEDLGDMWCLDMDTLEWQKINNGSDHLRISGHTMAVFDNTLLIFGDEVNAFDLSTKEWKAVDAPISFNPKETCVVKTDSYSSSMIIFGGREDDGKPRKHANVLSLSSQ